MKDNKAKPGVESTRLRNNRNFGLPEPNSTTTPPTSNHSSGPVRVARNQDRTLTDYELEIRRARLEWLIMLTVRCESPNPEHDRMILGWELQGVVDEIGWRERHNFRSPEIRTGFSREFLDELKSRMPLQELIINLGDSLRRVGKSWRGRCPIHNGDSLTSLSVWSDGFHCFKCKIGGDHFVWLAARWDYQFPDAVALLEALAGVETPSHIPRSVTNRKHIDARNSEASRAN